MIVIYKNRETVKVGIVRLSTHIRKTLSGKSRVHIEDEPRDFEDENKKMMEAVKQERGQRKDFLNDLMAHHKDDTKIEKKPSKSIKEA